MTDRIEIDTDDAMREALFQLFSLAGMPRPVVSISAIDVLFAVRQIQSQLEIARKQVAAAPVVPNSAFTAPSTPAVPSPPAQMEFISTASTFPSPAGNAAPSAPSVFAPPSAFPGATPASQPVPSVFGNPPPIASDGPLPIAMDFAGASLEEMAAMLQGGGFATSAPKPTFRLDDTNILIVSELGIVTYQVKASLIKLGATVTIVRGINEAITEYQKRKYTGVLIDIFVPTEREGLLVLSEIKRLSDETGNNSSIAVLATTVKETRQDLRDLCREKGASIFLEKNEGWHQRVVNFFSGNYEF